MTISQVLQRTRTLRRKGAISELSIQFQAMSFQVLGGIALVPALENITKVKDLTTARLWWSVEYICKLRSTAGLR